MQLVLIDNFWGEGRGGGYRKKLPLFGEGLGKKINDGGIMQFFNDSSKNPASPPYFVKNERSLISMQLLTYLKEFSMDMTIFRSNLTNGRFRD